jgi:hypothetical protein
MSEPTIKFWTTATMETDLEYEFELTQDEVDAAIKEYGDLENYVRYTVDGGSFFEREGLGGSWIWGEVHQIDEEEEEEED